MRKVEWSFLFCLECLVNGAAIKGKEDAGELDESRGDTGLAVGLPELQVHVGTSFIHWKSKFVVWEGDPGWKWKCEWHLTIWKHDFIKNSLGFLFMVLDRWLVLQKHIVFIWKHSFWVNSSGFQIMAFFSNGVSVCIGGWACGKRQNTLNMAYKLILRVLTLPLEVCLAFSGSESFEKHSDKLWKAVKVCLILEYYKMKALSQQCFIRPWAAGKNGKGLLSFKT